MKIPRSLSLVAAAALLGGGAFVSVAAPASASGVPAWYPGGPGVSAGDQYAGYHGVGLCAVGSSNPVHGDVYVSTLEVAPSCN